MISPAPASEAPLTVPTFREAVRFWFKLGCISFGGPAGQIAIMQTELVERRRWIEQDRFLHALNYCMLLPGPEAQQLATYCGWLLHGTRGGLAAGILFVLPAAVLLWGLSAIYVLFGNVAAIAGIFAALKPAVFAIIVAAVLKLGRKTLRTPARWTLAGASFVAIYFGHAPFPLIVFGAALLGWMTTRPAAQPAPLTATTNQVAGGTWRSALRVLALGLTLWFAPIGLALLALGPHHTLTQEGFFFSKAALVTFGGAYAVLPYVGQQAVNHFGWLTPPQMLDGLGLAETTPGPLVLVLQFVGFVGGYQHPGELPPLLAATLGAAITTWVTFVPCFMWIFLGAPHLDRLRGVARLNGALSAVTAAVVGVVLNLAVWFAWPVLWPHGHFDLMATSIALGAFVALQRFRVDLLWVILGAAAFGLVRGLIG